MYTLSCLIGSCHVSYLNVCVNVCMHEFLNMYGRMHIHCKKYLPGLWDDCIFIHKMWVQVGLWGTWVPVWVRLWGVSIQNLCVQVRSRGIFIHKKVCTGWILGLCLFTILWYRLDHGVYTGGLGYIYSQFLYLGTDEFASWKCVYDTLVQFCFCGPLNKLNRKSYLNISNIW
jgi:hypothetical protein